MAVKCRFFSRTFLTAWALSLAAAPSFADQNMAYLCSSPAAANGYKQCEGADGGSALDAETRRKAITQADVDSKANWGMRSDPGNASAPIDVKNSETATTTICRYVDNISGTKSLFVPFKTPREWNNFVSAKPEGTNLTHCAKPGLAAKGTGIPVPPDTNPSSSTYCANPSPSTPQTIDLPYYGRTGKTYQAPDLFATIPSVKYTCNGGSTTQTATPTAFLALDSDTKAPSWGLPANSVTYKNEAQKPRSCGPAFGVPSATAPDKSKTCTAPATLSYDLVGEADRGAYGTGRAGGGGITVSGGTWYWYCRVPSEAEADLVSCWAPKTGITAAACGSSNGTPVASLDASNPNLCGSGSSVANFYGSGPWIWICNAAFGGGWIPCTAPKIQTGACGSRNGTTVASLTASDPGLCDSTSSVSTFSGSGPWAWTCTGNGGGGTASCSALRTTSCAPQAVTWTGSDGSYCSQMTGAIPEGQSVGLSTPSASGRYFLMHDGRRVTCAAPKGGATVTCTGGALAKRGHCSFVHKVVGYNDGYVLATMWAEYEADSFSCDVSFFTNMDSCFPPDTPVLTPDRGWMPIAQIKAGDKVVSFDKAGARTEAEVQNILITADRQLRLVNGVRISTWQKIQMANGTYVAVEDLKVGDALIDTDGRERPITTLEDVPGKHMVYNLVFESRHTPFFAAGYRVRDWLK